MFKAYDSDNNGYIDKKELGPLSFTTLIHFVCLPVFCFIFLCGLRVLFKLKCLKLSISLRAKQEALKTFGGAFQR